MITKNEAQKLWGQLRNAILNLEGLLEEIVEKRAWEPLGYNTFHDAWEKELAGVKLAGAMQSKVIYAMFSAGATPNDVASAVEGIGSVKAKAYEEAYDKALPVNLADKYVSTQSTLGPLADGETIVHAHVRRKPQFSGKITVDGFDEEEVSTWKDLADKNQLDWKELVRETLRNGLNSELGVE